MRPRRRSAVPAAVVVAVIIGGGAGCGSSGSSSSASSGAGPSAAEATAAATGDIPDNQVFLTYRSKGGGYSLKYPEGWTRKVSGTSTTFTDKGNSISVSVASGPPPTKSKVTFSKIGPKDPVTGKRLQIITDRYRYSKGGKVATLDLATPKGVDNVDAYRLISQSFKWR